MFLNIIAKTTVQTRDKLKLVCSFLKLFANSPSCMKIKLLLRKRKHLKIIKNTQINARSKRMKLNCSMRRNQKWTSWSWKARKKMQKRNSWKSKLKGWSMSLKHKLLRKWKIKPKTYRTTQIKNTWVRKLRTWKKRKKVICKK